MNDFERLQTPSSDLALDRSHTGLIDSVLKGLCYMACIALPLSLSRITLTGWVPAYAVHIVVATIIVLLWYSRQRLSPNFKLLAIMAILWIIGIVGLMNFGLLGSGAWWLVISPLLAGIVHSNRAGAWAITGVLLTVGVIAAAYVQGLLIIDIDAKTYHQQLSTWGTFIISAVILPLIIFTAVNRMKFTIVDLLGELEAQSEYIRQLAHYDELTAIPRAHIATDRLEQALARVPRQGTKVGVLFFDLNGFKATNDTYGHEAGDFVLQQVAQRAKQVLRTDDTIARKGGDEFIVILQGLSSPDLAVKVAQKIQRAIIAPLKWGEADVTVGVSIGIAVAPDQGFDAESLIRLADQAMYSAKRAGSNQIRAALAEVVSPIAAA